MKSTAILRSASGTTSRGKERKRYNAASAVKSLDVHPDGKRIVSLHEDNVIRVWDALTGTSHVYFHALTERVARVTFSPSGRQLLCLLHARRGILSGERRRTAN